MCTLTEEQIPAHTHSYGIIIPANGYALAQTGRHVCETGNAWPTSLTGNSQPHSHDFTGSASQGSILPMYYSLSYIMRTM